MTFKKIIIFFSLNSRYNQLQNHWQKGVHIIDVHFRHLQKGLHLFLPPYKHPLRLFKSDIVKCDLELRGRERDTRACSLNTACGWWLVFVLVVSIWVKFHPTESINVNKSVRGRKRFFYEQLWGLWQRSVLGQVTTAFISIQIYSQNKHKDWIMTPKNVSLVTSADVNQLETTPAQSI